MNFGTKKTQRTKDWKLHRKASKDKLKRNRNTSPHSLNVSGLCRDRANVEALCTFSRHEIFFFTSAWNGQKFLTLNYKCDSKELTLYIINICLLLHEKRADQIWMFKMSHDLCKTGYFLISHRIRFDIYCERSLGQ